MVHGGYGEISPPPKTTPRKLCRCCVLAVALNGSRGRWLPSQTGGYAGKGTRHTERSIHLLLADVASSLCPHQREGQERALEGQRGTLLAGPPLAHNPPTRIHSQACTHVPPTAEKQSTIKWRGSVMHLNQLQFIRSKKEKC